MTDDEEQNDEVEIPRAKLRGAFLSLVPLISLLSALPILLVATVTVTGIGLQHNMLPLLALLAGILLVVLPARGVASLLGGGQLSHALGLWAWSAIVMLTIPAYFPGLRDSAARDGLRYITSHLDKVSAYQITSGGLEVLSLFGPEPRPTVLAKQRIQEPHAPGARGDAATPDEERLAIESEPPRPLPRRGSIIPYTGQGTSMRVLVNVDGPEFGEEVEMIFDTGATLSTLDQRTLETLDIHIPPDAPTVQLHTAAGEVEARLALLDAVWIGDEVVEWVTVAVCEPCSDFGSSGLLGLNVSSHFTVSIDHEAESIELQPRRGRRNRRLDIQPWLDLKGTLSHWADGRAEVEIKLANDSRHEISSTVIDVICNDQSFTLSLDPIPPFERHTTTAALPWGSGCGAFEISPISAAWALDRF